MRSISPDSYIQQTTQQGAILKPVIYEAVHVPINEKIIAAQKFRQNTSPIHIAPPSGQTIIKPILNTSSPMIGTTQIKLQTSVAEFQQPQSQEIINDKLKDGFEERLRTLRLESDSWKQKYAISENDKIKQLQDIENHYKMEQHNQLQSQKQFNLAQINELNEEIKHLQRELDNKNKEAEQNRRKCHQLEMDQFDLKTQIVDANAQKDSSQKELTRITSLYQRAKIDIDDMRTQQEILKKRVINEQELEKLKEIINLRENEIDDLKARNSQLEIISIDVRKMDTQNHQLSNQLEILQSQMSIYEAKIIEMRNEIDNLNQQNKRLNNQLLEKKNHAQLSKTILEQEIQNQLSHTQQLLIDKDNQIKQLNMQLQTQQIKIQQINETNQHLRENYEAELTDARNKQGKFEQEFQEDIAQKFQLMSKEIQQLQQERQQLLIDLQQQSQIKVRQENRIQQLQKDLDKCNYESQLRNKELNENGETIHQLTKQITVLTKEKSNLQEQIHKLHYQYQDFNKVNYCFEKVLCNIEMEALREKLDYTLQELETIKSNQLSMYKFQ